MINNNLQILDCSKSYLSRLDYLPESLKILNCSSNKLTYLDNLPPGLIELNSSSNKLTQLDYLPESFEILDCSINKLTQLDNLPQNLKSLNCNYCTKLIHLNNLPQTLINLYCLELWCLDNIVLPFPQELENFEITRINKNIIINGCEINPEIIYFTRPLDSRIYYSEFYCTGSGPPHQGLIKMNVNGCDVKIHGKDYTN